MKRRHLPRTRLFVVLSLVVAFWVVAAARLIQVQVFNHSRAAKLYARQTTTLVDIPAPRGTIRDRDGRILVANEPRLSFAADPSQWKTKKQRRQAAQRLARTCGGSTSRWLKRFDDHPGFVWIARDAGSEVSRAIERWNDPAVFALEDPGRSYPAGEVGRELLGWIDVDGIGVAGVEAAFDSMLAGRPAKGTLRTDAARKRLLDPLPASMAQPGSHVYLTIDWEWQEVVEEEVSRAVEKHNAKGGGAIFMTPDGAIRALAYVPGPRSDSDRFFARSRPVTDLFEPGSIFKAITAAAFLAEKKVRLDDSVYADSGLWRVDDRWIRDSEPHLWLTFGQSLVVSSNIAFGKWALCMDGPEFYRWSRDFGFGESWRIGLPAEPKGFVPNPTHWTDLAKAQIAMGHSVAVTPLQMVTAFASFATGGMLYRPYLLLAVETPEGDTIRVGKPEKVRRVMSPGVSKSLGELLVRVVTEGTATPANSEAITIAGKTGTAQKVREEGRGYHHNRFIASFVGYFPADHPQVVGIVYLDEPEPIHYGGWTAAPALTRIAERLAGMHPELLRYPAPTRSRPLAEELPEPELHPGIMPRLVGLPLSRAAACAARLGFKVEIAGSGSVKRQEPAAGTRLAAGDVVRLIARAATRSANAGSERAG